MSAVGGSLFVFFHATRGWHRPEPASLVDRSERLRTAGHTPHPLCGFSVPLDFVKLFNVNRV